MAAGTAGDDGVAILRGKNLVLVGLGDAAFFGSQETGAHLHAFGTQGEGGQKTSSVGDSTRCDDGDGYRLAHGGNQRHGGELADMAAGFASFRNHCVGADALHALGKCRGGDHGHHLAAGFLPDGNVVGRAARAGGDDIHLQLRQHGGDLRDVGAHHHHIAADGLIRQAPRQLHLLFHPFGLRRAACDDSQASRIADRCGEPAFGNPGHAALQNGLLYSQKTGYSCFHC